MSNLIRLMIAYMLSVSHGAFAIECSDGQVCGQLSDGVGVILDRVEVLGNSGYTPEDIVELFDIKLGVRMSHVEASEIIRSISQKLSATKQFDTINVSFAKSMVYPHYMIRVEANKRESSYAGADVVLQRSDWFGRENFSGGTQSKEETLITGGTVYWGTRNVPGSNLALDVEAKAANSYGHYSGSGDADSGEYSYKGKHKSERGLLGFTLISPPADGHFGYFGLNGSFEFWRDKRSSESGLSGNLRWSKDRSIYKVANGGLLIGKRWRYFQVDGRLLRSYLRKSTDIESSTVNVWLVNSEEENFRSSFDLVLGFSQKSGLLLVEPGTRMSLKVHCRLECESPRIGFIGEYTAFLTESVSVSPLYAIERSRILSFVSRLDELGGRFDVVLSPTSLWYLEFTRIRYGGDSPLAKYYLNHLELGTKYARPDLQLSFSFIVGSQRLFNQNDDFEGVQRSLNRIGGG